jgi:tetratricopeptide (TPR) repeat protein
MNRDDTGVIVQAPLKREEIMRKMSLLATAVAVAVIFGSAGIAAAMDNPNPSPPPGSSQQTNSPSSGSSQTTKGKSTKPKPKQKTSSAEDFLAGYHTAYALIYDKDDYVGGIATLRALGYDDNADVATLIGYASRKLGRYDDAKYWYDKALAADPNHVVTWSYYGMWHAEQGNLLKAKDDLEKVRAICGNTQCREYKALKDVIDGTVTY